jgi:secreted Zn-dependent insulinase-like peptidase
MARQVQALVLNDHQRTNVDRARIRQLPPSQTAAHLAVEHPDTGYTLYLQGNNTSYAERARYRLLAQIISSPFYEEIRTTRQLGYIVYATAFEILETPALGLVVQSPSADASAIDSAVKEFSQTFAQQLAEMDDTRLKREKQAVISQLLERDRQLSEVSSRYWREIDRENAEFNSRQALADAIRNVSLEELKETFEQAMLERQRALLVTTGGDAVNDEAILQTLRDLGPVPKD